MDNVRLPPLLRFDDGRPVTTPSEWRQRRAEVWRHAIELQYGALPPTPAEVTAEALGKPADIRWLPGATYESYRIVTSEPDYAFMLNLTLPPGEAACPVVIHGDGCWRYLTDTVTTEAINRGFIVAQFNRTEIVPDLAESGRDCGLYRQVPEGDFGALAAWAWGYHRVVDALGAIQRADTGRILITGHSRGGKTTLLAGATDERISVTVANNSGCGGAGCYRYQGPNSEALDRIVNAFPHWFSPRLKEYAHRENELPFDQHFVKALVAPRALLTCEALGDYWANPSGSYVTYRAARELYGFLGVTGRIGIRYREGSHAHTLADWCTALDFATAQFGPPPAQSRFDDPFTGDCRPPAKG